MFNKLHLILSVVFCLCAMNCFSAELEQEYVSKHLVKFQKEIQKLEKEVNNEYSQAKIEAIKANIHLLESLVNARIQKNQKKIEHYNNLISDEYEQYNLDEEDSDSSSDSESYYIERLQKRVSAKEKEIKRLQEVLFALGMLKMRIGG